MYPEKYYFDNVKITPLYNNSLIDSEANDSSLPNTPSTPSITPLSTTSLQINWNPVNDNGNTYYFYSKNIDNSGNMANIATSDEEENSALLKGQAFFDNGIFYSGENSVKLRLSTRTLLTCLEILSSKLITSVLPVEIILSRISIKLISSATVSS